MKEKINKKIILYENLIKKYQKLKKDIENNESEVNEQINQINELIKKAASLIKISDIFQNYKIELKNNIEKFPEYQEHLNIFNESNIDEFIISDLYEFLITYLKDGNFSIIKRDITNYNLFIEILTEFKELKYKYRYNVDMEM